MQHEARYTPGKLRKTLRKYGYQVNRVGTFDTFSFFAPGKFLSGKVCRLELGLDFPRENLILGFLKFDRGFRY